MTEKAREAATKRPLQESQSLGAVLEAWQKATGTLRVRPTRQEVATVRAPDRRTRAARRRQGTGSATGRVISLPLFPRGQVRESSQEG
jgi:hypothetical protein